MTLIIFICSICALINFGLSLIIFFKNPSKTVNRLFSLLLLLFVAWSLSEVYIIFTDADRFNIKLLFIPGIFLSYFFCIFTAHYPRYQNHSFVLSKPFNKYLLSIPAIYLLYLLFTDQIPQSYEILKNGFSINLGAYEFPVKGIIIGYLVTSLKTLSESRKSAETENEIKRFKYTFAAMLLPIAAGSISAAFSRWFMGGTTFYTFGIFPLLGIFMGIILSYTILKYSLMEIDLIFSIGLVYTMLTAILAGFIELTQELMQSLLELPGLWSKALTVLLVAAVFSPLKDTLIKVVDKFFGRKSFDSAKVIRQILYEVRQISDKKLLLVKLLKEMNHVLDFYSAVIVSADNEQILLNGQRKIEIDNSFLNSLPDNSNDFESILMGLEKEKDAKLAQMIETIKKLGYRHYFKLSSSQKDHGVLFLTVKKSRLPYTETELNLISGLSSEIPHILDNLETIQKLLMQQKAEQEIKVARDMLNTISAEDLETFESMDIASYFCLAKDIKGDMIDVNKSNNDSFLAIYDAFHHGIQAVLTLDVVFSVFRACVSVEDKLAKANDILRLFEGKNLCSAVTLLKKNGTEIVIYNLGNPPPIIMSSKKLIIKDQGSKPLGLENKISYVKYEFKPQNKDLIFVSTNGIYKAYQEFYKESLEAYLTKNTFKNALDCKTKVINNISGKIKTGFSDDITFFVVGIK